MKHHDLRISLIDANGEEIWGSWAKNLQNANSQIPISLTVQIQCDLGHLHEISHMALPLWSTND